MKFSGMVVGVPKEIMPGEDRVSAIPDTVRKITSEGGTVLVEKDAGQGAFFPDSEYVAAGAKIVDNVRLVDRKSVV